MVKTSGIRTTPVLLEDFSSQLRDTSSLSPQLLPCSWSSWVRGWCAFECTESGRVVVTRCPGLVGSPLRVLEVLSLKYCGRVVWSGAFLLVAYEEVMHL